MKKCKPDTIVNIFPNGSHVFELQPQSDRKKQNWSRFLQNVSILDVLGAVLSTWTLKARSLLNEAY